MKKYMLNILHVMCILVGIISIFVGGKCTYYFIRDIGCVGLHEIMYHLLRVLISVIIISICFGFEITYDESKTPSNIQPPSNDHFYDPDNPLPYVRDE